MLTTTLLLLACSVYESQFSSTIKEVIAVKDEPYSCHLILDIDLSKPGQNYSPSVLCPIHIEEVYGKKVYSQNCHFQKGDAVSGYLIKINERIELE